MNEKNPIKVLVIIITLIFCLIAEHGALHAQVNEYNGKTGPADFVNIEGNNTTLLGKWIPYGSCDFITGENNMLYYNNGKKLLIADNSDTVDPVVISEFDLDYEISFIEVNDGFLYLADFSKLHILDLRDPSQPEEISTFGVDKDFRDMIIVGNYAYLANWSGSSSADEGLYIIDIKDPYDPVELKFIPLENARKLELNVNNIFVICVNLSMIQNTVYSINIDDPLAPVVYESDAEVDWPNSICIAADHAFIVGRDGTAKTLYVLDLADPSSLSLVTTFNLEDAGFGTNADIDMAVSGSDLLLACRSNCGDDVGLQVLDISEPADLFVKSSFPVSGDIKKIYLDSDHAYLANGSNGMRICNISDVENIQQANHIDRSISTSFCDIAMVGDYVYLLSEEEGFHIINVSDPSNPVYEKSITLPGRSYSITVNDEYAYVANQGIRIYDVSDPLSPNQVGHWTYSEVEDIVIRGDAAFATAGQYLYIVDLVLKNYPFKLGEYYTDSRVVLEKIDVEEDYAFVGLYDWNIGVNFHFMTCDVTNSAFPEEAGRYRGTWGYSSWPPTAKGYFTGIITTGSYLYATNSYAGFGIFDVSNPTEPAEISFYRGQHYGLSIESNYAYLLEQSNDRLEILNISDPLMPFLAGSYEVDAHHIIVNKGIAYLLEEELFIIKNELVTEVDEVAELQPTQYNLEQNYPNPFNPTTIISFQLAVGSNVELTVYDVLGRKVKMLINKQMHPGSHDIEFDGNNLTSGIYIYKLTAGEFVQSRKMVLMR